MSTETTSNAEATEDVAKPVPSREIPPAGYRIFSTEEKWRLQIPDGALFFYESVGDWVPSVCIGQMAAHGQDYAVPISAQPTPSGPTAGDSMDVHYEVLKAENEALRAALGIEPDWTVPKQTSQFGSILVDRPGGRTRISPANENEQALAHRIAELQEEVETADIEFRNICLLVGFDPSDGEGTTPAEVTASVKSALTAAGAKAGAMASALAELKRNVVEVILPNAKNVTLDIGQIALWDICIKEVDALLALPPAPSVASEAPFEQLIVEYRQWVLDTFPGERVDAQAEHLKEEFKELMDDPSDPKEYADVLMLLLCVAYGHGVDVIKAFRDKFAINKARKWEKTEKGWRHVKESVASEKEGK